MGWRERGSSDSDERQITGRVRYSGGLAMANERTSDVSAQTPVMRQYFAAKQAHPDCLMMCRIGDFYELFYEDAIVASRELQLTLTARDREKKQPMCGVPYHAAEQYIQRLLRKGYRVALCDQMEDPKLTKKIVRREVTRVLTPGTAVDAALGAERSNWLASVAVSGAGADANSPQTRVGLALLDLSTGEFRATEFAGATAWAQLADQLGQARPAELLVAEGLRVRGASSSLLPTLHGEAVKDGAPGSSGGSMFEGVRTRTELEDWVFTAEYAVPLLRKQLGVLSLEGMGLGGHEAAAVAAGALVHYLQETMQGGLEHIDAIRFYAHDEGLTLDSVSVRNLELVEPLFSGESAETTLFHTLDACSTAMGKRLLRATLLRPAAELAEIEARLDAVGEAVGDLRGREGVRRAMNGLLDMERLLGRVALDSAGPREVMALAATLGCLPGLRDAVAGFKAKRWKRVGRSPVFHRDFHRINPQGDTQNFPQDLMRWRTCTSGSLRTIVEEPPVSFAEGGVIRTGVDAELDELRELGRSGRQALAAIEERERQRTGIGSLKVRFNSVFGYYLEVTKANSRSVPEDYERKQTLVNAERFTTPELKEYEAKILTAQERSGEIERRIFAELRRQLLDAAGRMRETARRVAEIDLLACFAHLAALRGWVRPQVEESGVLEFVAGRHPVVERRMEESGGGRFVPNSISLEGWCGGSAGKPTHGDETAMSGAPGSVGGASIALITGPNMGGKSTYLRQAALLVVMAQSGCFVPAERMRLGLVDRIYTRIGASDNVARGRSTFMVEMTETAAILNTATARSLVLLDEMGRGTATYDGLSLAWATVEHLHEKIGARTLFATHYHELTLLEERLARLKNLRVTAKETAGGIVFLHTVEAGAASKSYGIEVARLAGLPGAVIARAREVLKLHERAETQQVGAALARGVGEAMQMTMFTPLSQKIVDRLAEVDLDGLTPREALNLLAELQRELKNSG